LRPAFPCKEQPLSFFDEGDEPRTRTARPRPRPRGAAAGASARASAGGPTDHQQLLIRRAVAIGLGVVVLILLILGVKSCRNSARENALRTYNDNVSSLVRASDSEVARPFFALLTGARGKSPVTVETQVNQYRVVAEEQAARARALSVPGEVVDAQRGLELVLDFRAGALQKVADRIRTALGAQGADVAMNQIAGQMQVLLASDVVYSQRVAPLVKQALDANSVTGQTIASSHFVPNIGWLDPGILGTRLGLAGTGGTGNGTIAPGTHGHGLTSTTVGGVTLQPGGVANRIPASGNPTFTVSFQNQGSNDEHGVTVELRITGAGKPIVVRKTVDQTKAGATVALQIPLGQAPPVGTPVTITVQVRPVPGEKKTDNNSSTYTAFFTR
jgi:hypothetical protein